MFVAPAKLSAPARRCTSFRNGTTALHTDLTHAWGATPLEELPPPLELLPPLEPHAAQARIIRRARPLSEIRLIGTARHPTNRPQVTGARPPAPRPPPAGKLSPCL